MAAGGAPARQLRRGPAPIASFDHDVSDESSPESKQTFRLPEIREDGAGAGTSLAPPEQRARSHSSPAVGALSAPPAPRIDISRASSSSHHDSRDSSPELALFEGGGQDAPGRLDVGFREDGALELRSSTEELAFLEPAPSAPPPAPRRHSRKDSQGSEAALLAVSGRTSRLSSVGSQCSAHSALSAFSHTSRASGRLSVVSGISRSPSPHRMLLETSFCGPKPIETDPEICAAAVEERLLEMAKMTSSSPSAAVPPPAPVDARDRREVRAEVTVERAAVPAAAPTAAPASTPGPPATAVPPATPTVIVASTTAPPASTPSPVVALDDDKLQKETQNRARAQERRARPRVRREPSEPEVYKSANRSKDIIRIKLKPDDDYGEEDEEIAAVSAEAARKPDSLELTPRAARPTELPGRASPAPPSPALRRDSRTPSPGAAPASRKSSFCSLFKSRETIASPDSPSDALRRKRSLTEGRSRSKSRDRSATPSSAGKLRGSVLSLFRTPRRGAASPSPSSREPSPVVTAQRPIAPPAADRPRSRAEKLKYYEDAKDGIIHIPLKTPPDERPGSDGGRREAEPERSADAPAPREPRPASAPHSRPAPDREFPAGPAPSQKPIRRTVLPDGSVIIPLRSPTEKPTSGDGIPSPVRGGPVSDFVVSTPTSRAGPVRPESTSPTVAGVTSVAPSAPVAERRSPGAAAPPDPQFEPESAETPRNVDEGRRRRKERFVFTTHVGSREQVFSTQFSITKTPSVTSEISESFPSFADGEEARAGAAVTTPGSAGSARSAREAPRDSSGSEASSEGGERGGSEAERRGLVVHESFEEELPYVPTTLPQERSLALPMVPVRERGGVRLAPVERPRAPAPAPPAPALPAPSPAGPPAPADKLRIKLPRRPRTASVAAPPRPQRARTRSGGEEMRAKTEWIDFEEVPERRKQPKRIQTLPAAAAGGVVFSYVEPEHCRCECHARDPHHQHDHADHSYSSAADESGSDARGHYSSELGLLPDTHIDSVEPRPH